jgi:hypothetical protein
MSIKAHHDGRAGTRVEDKPNRVAPAADPQRMDLAGNLLVRNGRAHLEHMRAQNPRVGRVEMVGVVLHEGRSARQAPCHDLHEAGHDRGLPVALRPEPVAVGHQPLGRDAGQLLESVEVLERVGDRTEPAFDHEFPERDLDPSRFPQGLAVLAARAKRRDDVVGGLVDRPPDRRPSRPRRLERRR